MTIPAHFEPGLAVIGASGTAGTFTDHSFSVLMTYDGFGAGREMGMFASLVRGTTFRPVEVEVYRAVDPPHWRVVLFADWTTLRENVSRAEFESLVEAHAARKGQQPLFVYDDVYKLLLLEESELTAGAGSDASEQTPRLPPVWHGSLECAISSASGCLIEGCSPDVLMTLLHHISDSVWVRSEDDCARLLEETSSVLCPKGCADAPLIFNNAIAHLWDESVGVPWHDWVVGCDYVPPDYSDSASDYVSDSESD